MPLKADRMADASLHSFPKGCNVARKQARKRESSPQEAQDPPLILVIDDDEVSLALIGMLLRTDGFEVMEASSGEEALKLIAKLPSGLAPKAVLADLQMPGLCG